MIVGLQLYIDAMQKNTLNELIAIQLRTLIFLSLITAERRGYFREV